MIRLDVVDVNVKNADGDAIPHDLVAFIASVYAVWDAAGSREPEDIPESVNAKVHTPMGTLLVKQTVEEVLRLTDADRELQLQAQSRVMGDMLDEALKRIEALEERVERT